MKSFSLEHVWEITQHRKPDFENLKAVLQKKRPSRPTLFEFFLNDPLEQKLAGWENAPVGELEYFHCKIDAFTRAGYDYTTIHASDFYFEHENNDHGKASISSNEGCVITDWDSYYRYSWMDPLEVYNGRIERIEPFLPEGMKFIVCGPSGVLENVTALVGYQNLCYLLMDDPKLVETVFDQVGQRLLDYYKRIIHYDSVGAIVSNDDWGFNTQTMLPTADMRKYVFKWHQKIADLAHQAGKPVILHSCGNLETVWEDIIDKMKFDAKHSYEDNICPVETMYQRLKGRIAVLGGIDMDFVCRSTQEQIYKRCSEMAKMTQYEGYALGTGNSIPSYLPDDNYLAMILAVLDPME